MWQQIRALAWVHFRSVRNRFPRTGWGTILIWFLSLLWYGLFAGLGALLAFAIPAVGLATLRIAVPLALIAILVYWQVFPLATLSGGWSLQMGKLRVYPIKLSALFTIEVCLRLTTSPEAIVVLIGAAIGLARHPGIPVLSALALLLFIPLNLSLSIGFREALMRSGRSKRFRELRPLLFVMLAIAPQFLVRTEARRFFETLYASAGRDSRHALARMDRFEPGRVLFLRCPIGPWLARRGLHLCSMAVCQVS